jgi:hypothetical protein
MQKLAPKIDGLEVVVSAQIDLKLLQLDEVTHQSLPRIGLCERQAESLGRPIHSAQGI